MSLALSLGTLPAAPIAWDGGFVSGPNNSGNWSDGANWDTNAIPATNDAVTLGDVTSGTRTVTFNSPSVTLQSLTLTQTTAGASNILAIPFQSTAQTLTVTNGITLGTAAAGSTAGITITGPSAADSTVPLLTASGGLTVGTGGNLSFAFDAAQRNYTGMTGNLTLSGGMVDLVAPASAGTAVTIGTITSGLAAAGTTTISSGILRLQNAVAGGARLILAENLNWTGGTIQWYTTAPTITGAQYTNLRGLTNTIGAGAVFQRITNGSTVVTTNPEFIMQIASANNANQTLTQTLSTAVTLGNITLQEQNGDPSSTYTHAITSTAVGQGIGRVTLSTAGATTVFQLGSNLTSIDTSSTFLAAASAGTNNNRIHRIDLNGFTFNGTASTSGWTPNRPTISPQKSVRWDVTSSQGAGVLRATSFNFGLTGAVAGDSLTIGSGVTLEATGGAASANTLTGTTATYTFDANSTFRYSGAATSANAATLTSAVTIGGLQVQNGALRVAQASLSTGGDVAVSSSGTLDLNGTSAGALVLASGKNFSSINGTLRLSLGDGTALDTIAGSGAGTFGLTNTAIVLSLGSGFSYGNAYAILNGFNSGSLSNVAISGYDSVNYAALLGTNGSLSFSAIPEPGTGSTLLLGIGLLFLLRRVKSGNRTAHRAVPTLN